MLNPELVLVRGLPGSGKSTIARNMEGYIHIEADMYFVRKNGYQYDPSKIKDAHAWCQKRAKDALSINKNVVVSNTFTRVFEMEPYFEMAKKYGANIRVIEAKGNYKNIHNVPEQVIALMKGRWEKYENV